MVDAADLKSAVRKDVPVRVRPWAPVQAMRAIAPESVTGIVNRESGYSRTSAGRGAAVDHDLVEFSLSAPRISQVTLLEHFTVVANHLSYIDRIVPTVFGAHIVNVASKFLAVRRFPQPGATGEIVIGRGVDPDLSILNVARYVRPICLPPVDLLGCSRQAIVAPLFATFAA